jgi:putative FmdB family regulatory protein
MPLYEYQCDACGGRFERIRKFSDPPLDEPCPSCGGHVQKLISSPAIQFKGKGWYVTDYAKSGTAGTSKSDSTASEAKADAKSDASRKDSSSESKPETKTETKAETKTEAAKPAAPAKADKSST